MNTWLSPRILDLFSIDLPIIQAPMAGVDSQALARAVIKAGGLGSLACTLLSPEEIKKAHQELDPFARDRLNLNFFSHPEPVMNDEQSARWFKRLEPYYQELGLDQSLSLKPKIRKAFSETECVVLEEIKPKVVSFHFGLPHAKYLKRLKRAGIKIISSATHKDEALYLERMGCDAIIVQGKEAGGHRGNFLAMENDSMLSTHDLLLQTRAEVTLPLIAAGGISDAKSIAMALKLGADAVQLGTAYLFCPEAHVSELYFKTLLNAKSHQTVFTNVFSGRLARGFRNRFIEEVGPISSDAPPFPLAGPWVAPLRAQSEKLGSIDFMQMWAGEAAASAEPLPACELTLKLATGALKLLTTRL